MEISKEDFKELTALYKKAVEEKAESFFFKGGEVLTPYAKYMLEYLETQFNK